LRNGRFVLRRVNASLYGADFNGVAKDDLVVVVASVRLAVCRVAVGGVLPAGIEAVVWSTLTW